MYKVGDRVKVVFYGSNTDKKKYINQIAKIVKLEERVSHPFPYYVRFENPELNIHNHETLGEICYWKFAEKEVILVNINKRL